MMQTTHPLTNPQDETRHDLTSGAVRDIIAAPLHRCRHGQRGMTLIEIMIVVAIIAMVSGGVAIVAIQQAAKAKLSHAETGARTVRHAVQSYFLYATDVACPTADELVAERILDEGQEQRDPWGEEWVIACDGLDVWAGSRGPDRQLDTEDDIFVPNRERPGK